MRIKSKNTNRGNKAIRFGGKIGGVPTAVSMVGYKPTRSKIKRKVLVTVKMKMTPKRATAFLRQSKRSIR